MPEQPEPKRYGRGLFLATVAGGISSLFWGKSAWNAVSGVISPAAGTLAPFLPTQGWRIYTVSGSIPSFDRATWRLELGGLVQQPLSLTYDQLLALPKATQISTFHCVTGWTVKNVHWGGVRLTELFDRAKPAPEAGALAFISAEEPYVDYLTMRQARMHDVMLAYEMDGKPLPSEHGAPLRLVIPEMYGYKNVKWLKQIALVRRAQNGYWENLGYDRNAWVGHSNGFTS
jgi:DMSO/TMAO reductase YedYZ molybdopterin-dependent catalytic subunit